MFTIFSDSEYSVNDGHSFSLALNMDLFQLIPLDRSETVLQQ